jgi:hypothetical protein
MAAREMPAHNPATRPIGNIVGAVVTRLVGAVLLEANDEWQLQHRYMQVEAMVELLAPEPQTLRLPPLAA